MPPRWLALSGSLALVGIVALAAAARFWAIDFGLPYTQARPDETFIIDVALSLLKGEFWPPFYDYPRLYPYAVALLYLGYYAWGALIERFSTLADMVASWPLYWPPFFLLSRGLSAAAGTLTVVVVHAIGKRLAGRGAGLIAALFMSLAFLHVRDSHFGTTDVAMTLLAVASVWWLIRDDHDAAGRHSVWAAVSAGLATATKYTAMFLVVPIGLSALLQAVRAGRRRALPVFARRGAVLGGGFLLALSIGVPFVLFDFARFSTAMSQLAGSMRVGMTPQLGLPNGWWFHFSQSLRYGMGVPLLGLGLMGGVVMAFRDWPRALVFWAFPITCFAVAGAISNLFTRYVVPIVPFLCVGAAIAVVEIGRVIGARLRVHHSVVATLVAVAVVAPSAWSVVRFDRIMAHADNRVLVADWVQRHVPPGVRSRTAGRSTVRSSSGESTVSEIGAGTDGARCSRRAASRPGDGPTGSCCSSHPFRVRTSASCSSGWRAVTSSLPRSWRSTSVKPATCTTRRTCSTCRLADLPGSRVPAPISMSTNVGTWRLKALPRFRGRGAGPGSHRQGVLRIDVALLALFVVLACVHTWPLATAPGTWCRNDTGDPILNEWTLAWVAHQIVTDPLHLFDANIFYPERNTLAYSEHMLPQALMVAPVLWLGGSPVLAHNLALLAGLTLTGWTFCFVARRWTGSVAAGLVAGSAAAFNAHSLTRLAHLQAQHMEFLALALLAIDRVLTVPRVRSGPGAGGLVVATGPDLRVRARVHGRGLHRRAGRAGGGVVDLAVQGDHAPSDAGRRSDRGDPAAFPGARTGGPGRKWDWPDRWTRCAPSRPPPATTWPPEDSFTGAPGVHGSSGPTRSSPGLPCCCWPASTCGHDRPGPTDGPGCAWPSPQCRWPSRSAAGFRPMSGSSRLSRSSKASAPPCGSAIWRSSRLA